MTGFGKGLVLAVALFLAACGSRDLAFRIQYDTVDGLKKGADLMHGDTVIGRVNDIQYTDSGNIEVLVTIDEPYRALAKSDALFVIASVAGKEQDKNVELVERSASGNVNSNATPPSADSMLIAENQLVQGADPFSGKAQQWQNQLNNVFQSFSDGVSKAWSNWEEKNLDQQLLFMEKELDRIIGQIKNLGESSRKQLETEVIPQLKQQIELLKKKLQALGRENELDPIEKKMDTVTELVEA